MQSTVIEARLEGGSRVFWTTITPTACGCLTVLSMPDFCRPDSVPVFSSERAGGHWDLWPIDNPARPNPLNERDLLCRPIQVTDRTLGLALISLQQNDDDSPRRLWIELFLSTKEPAQNGRTVVEDWAEILRLNKDATSSQTVLRLTLGAVTPGEIACFKSHKKLVTFDLALEVRPR